MYGEISYTISEYYDFVDLLFKEPVAQGRSAATKVHPSLLPLPCDPPRRWYPEFNRGRLSARLAAAGVWVGKILIGQHAFKTPRPTSIWQIGVGWFF